MLAKLIALIIYFLFINDDGAVNSKKRSPEQLFDNFIQTYNRSYANPDEKLERFNNFKKNLKYIDKLNKRHPNAKFDITADADKTIDERQNGASTLKMNYNELGESSLGIPEYMNRFSSIPKSYNWRDKKVVTSVKAQGQCGSCWAFSTVAAIESQYAIKYGKIIDLSEQQLVDCVGNYTRKGCSEGYPMDAMRYVARKGGLMLENDYPYKGHQGKCLENADKTVQIEGRTIAYQNMSENLMKQYLYHYGPMTLYLCMHDEIRFYKSGIMTPLRAKCPISNKPLKYEIRHIVLLAGYGHENGVDFWLIKNSWGADFGEDGYFKLVRGKKAYDLNHYITIFDMEGYY